MASQMLNGEDVWIFHLPKLYSEHIWTALWQASNVKRGEDIRIATGSLQLFWFATDGLHNKNKKIDITEPQRS